MNHIGLYISAYVSLYDASGTLNQAQILLECFNTGPSYPVGTVGTVPRAYELTRAYEILRKISYKINAMIGEWPEKTKRKRKLANLILTS
jgi:hypothetical protein